jgi:hypothetical protein
MSRPTAQAVRPSLYGYSKGKATSRFPAARRVGSSELLGCREKLEPFWDGARMKAIGISRQDLQVSVLGHPVAMCKLLFEVIRGFYPVCLK